MKSPIKGMKISPYGEEYMAGAFIDFVFYCLHSDATVEEFLEKTGNNIKSLTNRTPIEKAIDEATGYESNQIAEFADFVAENYWGIGEVQNGI